jgi:hypothetical protein
MPVEVAKPVTFILCILSLYAVFHAAFMVPASDLNQKIYQSVISGLSFRAAEPEPQAHHTRLISTLPLQVFCWAAGAMLVLFLVSLYLETHCIFYRDTHL